MRTNKETSYRTNYKTMYLVYVNNFLTVSRFAEYFSLSLHQANVIIKKGRVLHWTDLGSIV